MVAGTPEWVMIVRWDESGGGGVRAVGEGGTRATLPIGEVRRGGRTFPVTQSLSSVASSPSNGKSRQTRRNFPRPGAQVGFRPPR
ncbi:MAG: hypothetical protein QM811_02245 [Pirellulales bacterium]